MDDIQKYVAGLKDFQTQIKNTFNKPFEKLNTEQKIQALNTISADKTAPFEFMPSRYLGCVEV